MEREERLCEVYLGCDCTAYVIKNYDNFEVKQDTPYGIHSDGLFDTLQLAMDFIIELN